MNPGDFELIPWIGKTAKLIHIFMNDTLSRHEVDLTMQQWIVLFKLQQEDDLTQQELAIITERNKGSLTRLIDTLEKKNLVARIPSAEDKRVNRILLTKQGTKVVEESKPFIQQAMSELQSGMSDAEIKKTIELMKIIQ
ncbi:MAG: MarR family transcriptional regulator, partial [Bacteroidota bacterium]